MKRFLLLHVGFETPTPEIMQAWRRWFESAASRTGENAGLRNGREISKSGVRDLEMGPDALTGYTIINAEDMSEAEAIARENPFITAIRIYELATH
ncbi:MAG: hypothetical protein NW206_09070 [Hyphomonadaceae bacterium]|nr:hypothetical protein [Hyphomonadaceae bacterium]